MKGESRILLRTAFEADLHKDDSASNEKRGRWGGSVLIVMHGRSRMAIDLRIPTMPDGARRVFTDQADIASTKREAS